MKNVSDKKTPHLANRVNYTKEKLKKKREKSYIIRNQPVIKPAICLSEDTADRQTLFSFFIFLFSLALDIGRTALIYSCP